MSQAATKGREASAWRSHYALGSLFLVLMFSLIDRNILSILLVDIQAEFGASDRQMGFLTGTAFAVSNALAGIPLARLADRARRTTIVAAGLAVWSALTAGQGLAQSFALLATARVGVGIGLLPIPGAQPQQGHAGVGHPGVVGRPVGGHRGPGDGEQRGRGPLDAQIEHAGGDPVPLQVLGGEARLH